MNWTERVCMLLVSVGFKRFMLFCLRFCWFPWGFVAPRASWGSRGALGELWGVSGAPRVGFGTFWGDLGGSQGGVQSSLLGSEYVTNIKVLELGRFLMKRRVFLVFIVFHGFHPRPQCGTGSWIRCKNKGIWRFTSWILVKNEETHDRTVESGRWFLGS